MLNIIEQKLLNHPYKRSTTMSKKDKHKKGEFCGRYFSVESSFFDEQFAIYRTFKYHPIGIKIFVKQFCL